MAIKTYKKGTSIKLSNNFNSKEFDCHGSKCCSSTSIDEKLVEYLQKIRDHFGKPITISSAYRCATHNKNVGGATGSRHTKGQAADIYIVGVSPAEIARYAESIGILGIGLYETNSDGHFVHIDTRTQKSFWYGQAQRYRSTFGGSVADNNVNKDTKINTIKEVQDWANTKYKSGIVADGVYGNQTKTALVKILQKEINELPTLKESKLVVDGIWGKMTECYCPTVKRGDKNDIVGVLQALLICNGYKDVYIDNDYGAVTYLAVKEYQKKNKLIVDGIAGKNTFAKLCN